MRSAVVARYLFFAVAPAPFLVLGLRIAAPRAILKVQGAAPYCSWQGIVGMRSVEAAYADAMTTLVRDSVEVRSEAGLNLWRTPQGDWWVPAGSDDKEQQYRIPFAELAEKATHEYVHPVAKIRLGDIVLDCGANIGVFTRTALEAGAKLVVAVEPARENIECLRRNLETEIDSGRVIIYPKGVWNRDELLPMHQAGSSAGYTFVGRGGSTTPYALPLTTIDKLVADLKLERVDFIKMDIEGAEPYALLGGTNTIRRFAPRMAISSEHAPDESEAVRRTVARLRPYQSACGFCMYQGGYIRPHAVFFW